MGGTIVDRDAESVARHYEGPEERPAQVEEQVLILNDHLERLGVLVARIEDRLASVVRPHDDELLVAPAVPGIVGLADRLRDRNGDLARFNARLQVLLDHCEL